MVKDVKNNVNLTQNWVADLSEFIKHEGSRRGFLTRYRFTEEQRKAHAELLEKISNIVQRPDMKDPHKLKAIAELVQKVDNIHPEIFVHIAQDLPLEKATTPTPGQKPRNLGRP